MAAGGVGCSRSVSASDKSCRRLVMGKFNESSLHKILCSKPSSMFLSVGVGDQWLHYAISCFFCPNQNCCFPVFIGVYAENWGLHSPAPTLCPSGNCDSVSFWENQSALICSAERSTRGTHPPLAEESGTPSRPGTFNSLSSSLLLSLFGDLVSLSELTEGQK